MIAEKPDSKRIHIIKSGSRWAVRKQESVKALRIYVSKNAAIKRAKKFQLSGYDVVIHKKDGSIDRWEKAAS